MDQAAIVHFLENMVSLAVPARAFLGTHGRITNVPSSHGTATAEFETVWENQAKTAGSTRVADEINWPILPYAEGKILYAFRLYLEYRVRVGLNQDMAYPIRNEVPVKNEHDQVDYANLDERLIWCIEHTGTMH